MSDQHTFTRGTASWARAYGSQGPRNGFDEPEVDDLHRAYAILLLQKDEESTASRLAGPVDVFRLGNTEVIFPGDPMRIIQVRPAAWDPGQQARTPAQQWLAFLDGT